MLALEGILIVDLTEALAGPYATMLLGDLGAEVIKIERPGVGDQSRKWGARLSGGESAYFASTNRNKRSLTLNIQSDFGQRVMVRLLSRADVFVCNIPRLDSLQRAGLDPEALSSKFPRLIYASITGYGRTGPYAGRSGYDAVAQGEAGLMSLTGTEETVPMRYPVPIADMTAGLFTVIGVLAALRVREQTGRGQLIDNSLLECQASWSTILAGDYFATGLPPSPIGNSHPSIVPYQVFHTADKDMIVAVGSEKLWWSFCEAIGLGPDIRDDSRFAYNPQRVTHRAELVPLIQEALATRTADAWLARLLEVGVPCGPINTLPELLHDEHFLARGNLVELDHPTAGRVFSLANPARLSETGATYRRPPPLLGEHTEAILAELGFTTAEISGARIHANI